MNHDIIQPGQEKKPANTEETKQSTSVPETTNTPNQSEVVTSYGKKSYSPRLLIILLLLLAIIAASGAVYYFKFRENKAPAATQTTVENKEVSSVITPETAFTNMLEKNRQINSYHVEVKHSAKSRSGTNASEYDKTYTYAADVDVSDLKSMKLKGTFDLDKSGKQAKGETIWINEDVYIKLTEALVTDYRDVPCGNPSYRTAKSPSIALLKAGFVKTVRSDQTLNCGMGAYEDFISPITFTNSPFSEFPLFNDSALSDLEKRAFAATQNGQYKIYDGTLTSLNDIPAYSYNVMIENYKISEMSKILAKTAGFVEDNNHIISFGEGGMGQGSPGRYLKVWVNAQTRNLLRVQSIVDTPDVDIMFDTIVDYSKINEPVTITAPNR